MIQKTYKQRKLDIFPLLKAALATVILCLVSAPLAIGQGNNASFRLNHSGQGLLQSQTDSTYQRNIARNTDSSFNSLRSNQPIRMNTPQPLIIGQNQVVKPLRTEATGSNQMPSQTSHPTQIRRASENQTQFQQARPANTKSNGFANFHASNSLSTTEIQRMIDESEREIRQSSRQQIQQSNYLQPTGQTAEADQVNFVDGNKESQTKPSVDNAWNFGAERLSHSMDTKHSQLDRKLVGGQNENLPQTTSSGNQSSKAVTVPANSQKTISADNRSSPSETGASENVSEKAKPESTVKKTAPSRANGKSININQTIQNVSFATAAILVVSVIAIVALKKLGVTGAGLSSNTRQEAAVLNRTSLNSKCHVHLVQFKNHKIVVGVDQTGIKSMLCLPSSFVEELDGASDESRTL